MEDKEIILRKVEQGFQCSGTGCDGAVLENIHESSHNPDASFN